jgi:hypothetical protein
MVFSWDTGTLIQEYLFVAGGVEGITLLDLRL